MSLFANPFRKNLPFKLKPLKLEEVGRVNKLHVLVVQQMKYTFQLGVIINIAPTGVYIKWATGFASSVYKNFEDLYRSNGDIHFFEIKQ